MKNEHVSSASPSLSSGGEPRTLADFVPIVTAVDDTSRVKSGRVDVDGSYQVRLVSPGTYTVGFAGTVEFGVDTLAFAQVAVSGGRTAQVDYVVHSVTCP